MSRAGVEGGWNRWERERCSAGKESGRNGKERGREGKRRVMVMDRERLRVRVRVSQAGGLG